MDWKRPVPLDVDHQVAGFTCGKEALDEWLVRRAAEAVGVVCMLVHAKDEGAKNFYLRYGFESSPTDPLHSILLLKDIPSSLTG